MRFLQRRDVTIAFASWGAVCAIFAGNVLALLAWVFAICVALSLPRSAVASDSEQQRRLRQRTP
jgi:hypothetical protein